MNTHRPRVLIFVVAYEAESTLQRVLDRIPRPMCERFDAAVLAIDNSSSDRTFGVGVRSTGASSHPITVFYNRTNQGYRGNRKLGYQYALRNGFEFVVLLHGDGQYPPESMPALLQPLVDCEAEGFLIRLSRGLFSYQIPSCVSRRPRRLTRFSRTRLPAVSRERARHGVHSRKSSAAGRRCKAPPKRWC